MRIRTIVIVVFALVFGVSAAVGVSMLGMAAPADVDATGVSVVVATADINRGQTLLAEHLTTREWPRDLVPEGAITDMATVVDRTVAIPLIKGDLLVDGKLAVKGSGRGLAAMIPAGMRAVTIQTPNVATGVAGFILPGNKVDILLTMNNQGATDRTGGGSTITLVQNLEILAVDQQTDVPEGTLVDSKDLRSVTLLVTPTEAARIDLGQNKGTLRLTLRNPTDKATTFVDSVTLNGLSSNLPQGTQPGEVKAEPPPAVESREKAIHVIRTLRGTRSGMSPLPTANGDPTGSTTVPG